MKFDLLRVFTIFKGTVFSENLSLKVEHERTLSKLSCKHQAMWLENVL